MKFKNTESPVAYNFKGNFNYMKLYHVLLHTIGYSLYRKTINVDDEPIVIVIDSSNNNISAEGQKENAKQIKKANAIFILKILYNIFIFSLLSWQVLYALIYAIREREVIYFGGYLFQIIFSSQYIIGVLYFKDNHFYKKMESTKTLEKYLTIIYPICIIISMILSTLTITLTYHNITLSQMSMLYVFSQHMTPFLAALIVLDKFYGYSSFLINVVTFSIIIYDHQNEASDYTKRIETYMQGSVTISDKMSTISTELIKIKDAYDLSVTKLNTMFSSLTILGLCYVYFVIKISYDYEVDTMSIINMVLFLIVEYMYITFAQNFRSSASDIYSAIYRNVYAIHFLQKNNSKQEIMIPIPDDSDDNIEWDDKEINESREPVFTGSDMSKKLLDEIYKTHQSDKTIKTHINLLHMAVRKIHIFSAEIAENVTWSHLQEIVNRKWASFQILGFEIDDTLLLQKLIGIAMVILIANDLGDIIAYQI